MEVASITGESQIQKVVSAEMLPGDYVFDMEN
jgi:hypothetical protein